MKEKKLRIEDALNSTRAAVEEGIVAGGGTALADVTPDVAKLLEPDRGRRKDRCSDRCPRARRACPPDRRERRFRQGSVVIEKVKDAKKGVGFDAYDETYGDMIKKGIGSDPTKVTRSALQQRGLHRFDAA